MSRATTSTGGVALEALDLRPITRNWTKSMIYVLPDLAQKFLWITAGALCIRMNERTGVACVGARLPEGVTDFEHSSAWAFQLPVVGLDWDRGVGLDNGVAVWRGWIKPVLSTYDANEFRVPAPGYNPMKLKGAYTCNECEEPHPVVPEGCYGGAPFDRALYEKVRGLRVKIWSVPPSLGRDADTTTA